MGQSVNNSEATRAGGRVQTFGVYEVRIAGRELRKQGVKIRLSRQGFQVLAELIEVPGRVVTREELCQALWSDDTHVSYETNLNSIVHDVREALGDTARNPRFIETVAGQGYRFLAPVTENGGETRQTDRRWVYGLGAALVLVIALWGGLRAVRGPAASVPSVPRIFPFTSLAGYEAHPRFSPGGRQVAFHWNGREQGANNIYIKTLGAEDHVQLTDDAADDMNPEWSADGATIAWVRVGTGYTSDIMTTTLGSDDERLVKTIPTSASTLSWSPDGAWIAYSVAYPDYLRRDSGTGIFAVAPDTGRTVRLTEPGPRTIADLYPAISPDGSMLAYVRVSSYGAGDLFVAGIGPDLAVTGKPRRLTSGGFNVTSPAWTPDSKELIFSGPRAGNTSLWRVSVSDDAVGPPVALGGQDVASPSVSPDGSSVVFAVSNTNLQLWRLDVRDENGSESGPVQLTHSTKTEGNPSISPDGTQIAYASTQTGNLEIWVVAVDGTQQRRLTSIREREAGTPRWSPDGKFVSFDSRMDGQGEIFVVAVDGGRVRRVTVNPADDIVPSWSRDGKWIYFASNRSGTYQVWKTPVNGGAAVQVTEQGGFHAQESPDGTCLFYLKRQFETDIWTVPVAGGEEHLVAGVSDYWQNFSVSRTGVFFTSRTDGQKTLIRAYNPSSAETRQVRAIDGPSLEGMAASPDGRFVVYAQRESENSDLAMMELTR